MSDLQDQKNKLRAKIESLSSVLADLREDYRNLEDLTDTSPPSPVQFLDLRDPEVPSKKRKRDTSHLNTPQMKEFRNRRRNENIAKRIARELEYFTEAKTTVLFARDFFNGDVKRASNRIGLLQRKGLIESRETGHLYCNYIRVKK